MNTEKIVIITLWAVMCVLVYVVRRSAVLIQKLIDEVEQLQGEVKDVKAEAFADTLLVNWIGEELGRVKESVRDIGERDAAAVTQPGPDTAARSRLDDAHGQREFHVDIRSFECRLPEGGDA